MWSSFCCFSNPRHVLQATSLSLGRGNRRYCFTDNCISKLLGKSSARKTNYIDVVHIFNDLCGKKCSSAWMIQEVKLNFGITVAVKCRLNVKNQPIADCFKSQSILWLTQRFVWHVKLAVVSVCICYWLDKPPYRSYMYSSSKGSVERKRGFIFNSFILLG